MEQASRFVGFDILKYVFVFFVVCIHTPFPDVAGEYFTVLTRIAVPILFMITGFYYSAIVERGRIGEQIKKLFILAFEANLLYLLLKCLYAFASGDGFMHYISGTFTLKNTVKFIVLNDSPFSYHLWYLGAILYVLLVVYALRKICGGTGNRYCTFQCQYLLSEI